MKKILGAFLFFVLLNISAFSQDSENMSSSSKSQNPVTMKAGGFFNFEPVLGTLSDYVVSNIGGGLSYEIGFSVFPAIDIGASLHIAGNGTSLKKENADLFSYIWNTKFYAGGFVRIPFGKSGFVFQPEIDWGFVFYFPKANQEYVNSLDSVYADQILQIAASFRYVNPNVLNELLEFELSPIYSFSPEKNAAVHHLGFRVGVLYRFM